MYESKKRLLQAALKKDSDVTPATVVAANEISIDTTLAAALSELGGIF